MKEVKTIFVDCDGVLYDAVCLTYEQMVGGCQRAGLDLGIDWSEVQEIHTQLKAQGWRGWYNTTLFLCRRYGVNFKDISEKMVQYVDYSHIQQDLELLTLLQQVASQKKLYILTNNTRAHVEKVFQRLFHKSIQETGLIVLTIEDTLWGKYFYVKSHPEAFIKWCQKFETASQETLMLDDTEDVIESAKGQGLQTIQTFGPKQLKKILKGFL